MELCALCALYVSDHMAVYKIAMALPVSEFSLSVQTQHILPAQTQHLTLYSPMMSSINFAKSDRAVGTTMMGFRLTEIAGQIWSGDDVQDGKQDPGATSLRLKVDVDIREVYREANNGFRFTFKARVAIVRKDEPTETHHAMTEGQRGELMSNVRHLAMLRGDPEQMSNDSSCTAYMLDDMPQPDSLDRVFKDLQALLWVSAFSRVGKIQWEQSHGPESIICSYLDSTILAHMVIKMISRVDEEWLGGERLQALKDMPAEGKYTNEGPYDVNPMPSSEAFAVVVTGFELRLQLIK